MHTTEPKQASERAYLSLSEAADQLGCTRRFLEKRIDDGEIARFAPSKRLVRIKRTELDRWIESYTARKGGVVA
ncbi:MAG: helix-turn-helix domain-containing protein [Verrucomicrobia bacterium]|nr:MAG: helix-turn-helix domain-containing protein [Verrucomicrobiota bacterium]